MNHEVAVQSSFALPPPGPRRSGLTVGVLLEAVRNEGITVIHDTLNRSDDDERFAADVWIGIHAFPRTVIASSCSV